MKKTMRYLKRLGRTEVHGGSFEPRPQAEEGAEVLDPIQMQRGRREELEHMVETLQIFEFWFLARGDAEGQQSPDHDEMGRSDKEG